MRITHPKQKPGTPSSPCTMAALGGKEGYFKSCPRGSETLDMTSVGSGEMFEGDPADTCGGKFPP